MVAGVRHLFEREGWAYADVGRVVHATTLFTNALIERRGARNAGLITTEGFRDNAGDRARAEVRALRPASAAAKRALWCARALPRRKRSSAWAPDGTVEIALDPRSVRKAAERLVAQDVCSIAIVFLHAYANPAHEREAARIIAEAHPGHSAVSFERGLASRSGSSAGSSTTLSPMPR